VIKQEEGIPIFDEDEEGNIVEKPLRETVSPDYYTPDLRSNNLSFTTDTPVVNRETVSQEQNIPDGGAPDAENREDTQLTSITDSKFTGQANEDEREAQEDDSGDLMDYEDELPEYFKVYNTRANRRKREQDDSGDQEHRAKILRAMLSLIHLNNASQDSSNIDYHQMRQGFFSNVGTKLNQFIERAFTSVVTGSVYPESVSSRTVYRPVSGTVYSGSVYRAVDPGSVSELIYPARRVKSTQKIKYGVPIPRTYREAVADKKYGAKWKQAVQEEIRSLVQNGTWEEYLPPKG
jgi:hypothetical protein